MGSRRKARIIAFQSLFGWDMSRTAHDEVTRFSWLDADRRGRLDSETLDFARLIVAGCLESLDTIDSAIRRQLENWDFSRLSRVDLAILRMSVYSLFFQHDIPVSVTIDEAVDIAKEFGSDDSYRFINGVLDGIRKAQELLK